MEWTNPVKRILLLSLGAFFAGTLPAAAYIGPGLGVGTILVVLGVIGSVLLAIFAIVWYPMKRMFSRKKGKKPSGND